MSFVQVVFLCVAVVAMFEVQCDCDFSKRWIRGDCGDQKDLGWDVNNMAIGFSTFWKKDIENSASQVVSTAKRHTNQEIQRVEGAFNWYKTEQVQRISRLSSEVESLRSMVKELKISLDSWNREHKDRIALDLEKKLNETNINDNIIIHQKTVTLKDKISKV